MKKQEPRKYCWYTTYLVDNPTGGYSKYASYVIAESEIMARLILKLRCKDEIIESAGCKIIQNRRLPSLAKTYKAKKFEECLHTLSFLLDIFIKAAIVPISMFEDTGIVHEVIHDMQFHRDENETDSRFGFRKDIYNKLCEYDSVAEFLGF